MLYVKVEDFANPNYSEKLPVYQGCSGACCCTGRCNVIIGWIDHKAYREFMASYVSLDDFISSSLTPDSELEETMLQELDATDNETTIKFDVKALDPSKKISFVSAIFNMFKDYPPYTDRKAVLGIVNDNSPMTISISSLGDLVKKCKSFNVEVIVAKNRKTASDIIKERTR